MNRILKLATRAVVVLALTCVPALAGTFTYTTLASFSAAISGGTTANFDSDTADTVIFTGAGSGVADGITFSGSIHTSDQELVIDDTYDTTSGANYLGTTDPTTGALFGSDSLTMTFSSPVTAIGLYLLEGNALNAGDFTLDIGVGTALNSATADVTLGDGTLAYYLGITSTTPFTSATISPTTLGAVGSGPLWNLDDITTGNANGVPVPEPGTLMLAAAGLGALLVKRRTKA